MKVMKKIMNHIIIKQSRKNIMLKKKIRELKKEIEESEEEKYKLKKFNYELQQTNYVISYNNIDLIEQRKKYQKRIKQIREEKIELERIIKNGNELERKSNIKTSRRKRES